MLHESLLHSRAEKRRGRRAMNIKSEASAMHRERGSCGSLSEKGIPTIGWRNILMWMLIAAVGFVSSYAHRSTGWLSLIYLFALLQLSRAAKWRLRFYPALGLGLVIAVTHLNFFWTIFYAGAIALWLVYAIWIAIFAALTRVCMKDWPRWCWLAIPFLWTGIEYFRSELYYLRFSW